MFSKRFDLSPFNAHYDGAYDARMLAWRRLGAVEKVDNLQALLGAAVTGAVLEVGCGTGAVLAEIARRGIGTRHVGVDLAEPDAHRDPDAAGLTLQAYDGVALPFADASFDLVVASHVVEHVPDPRGFLAELARVAKDRLYLEVPCELHARTSHAALQATADIGHINAFTPESFLLLLQTSGLEVARLELFDHSREVHAFATSPVRAAVKMRLRRALLGLNPVLASRVFTYHCGALARRVAP